ncbi:MAG TPA: hypothetical protein VGI93_00615 [Steroidobacteraceae bacterium]
MSGGAYLVGVAFWVFVGASAVAAIISEHKKRRLGVDLLRAAIDKGQPLDPQMVERVFQAQERENGFDPVGLRLGGIITIACGVGLVPVAVFIRMVATVAFFPIMAGAALSVCVGLGLLIGARMVANANQAKGKPTP